MFFSITNNDNLINGKNILHDLILNNEQEKILKVIIKDKKLIGRPILCFPDVEKKLPLHIAILSGNIETIKLILKYSTKEELLFKTLNDKNSLHISVEKNNFEIFNEVINKYLELNMNLSVQNYYGNTSLHIACMCENLLIIEYLLRNKADPNIQNYTDEYIPLNYVKSVKITDILVSYGSNVNNQDYYGNTILHYSIINKNAELTEYLLNLGDINFNEFNIFLNLPIHTFIIKNSEEIINNKLNNIQERNLVKLINVSLLNFQNKKGETPFFLLVKYGIWEKYSKYLELSKLDISIKSKNGENILCFINENNIKVFKEMMTNSYVNRLNNLKGKKFKNEWETICSNINKNKNDKNNIKKLKNIAKLNNEDIELLCKKIIDENLELIIQDINDDDNNNNNNNNKNIYKKSYPILEDRIYLDIEFDDDSMYCTFVGLKIDILFGLIYLISTRDNSVSPLDERLINISSNENANFEIIWKNNNLIVDKILTDLLKLDLSDPYPGSKRFVIIPLGIELGENAHSNYLIYDKKTKELERFEPYGCSAPQGFNYNMDLLDNKISKYFNSLTDKKITYFRPKMFMDKICFQHLDSLELDMKISMDPAGFCAVWSIWYVDMRTKYYDMERKELVKRLIKNIISKNYSFKRLIRGYSEKIVSLRNKFLNYGKISINDWVNERYDDIQVKKVIRMIKYYISNVRNSK